MINVKKFFETPKKAILSTVCIAASLTVLGGGSVVAANVAEKSSAIGETAAQNYAFADAGVDPASAIILKTEFDFDDGHFLYEIDFLANGYEYEYKVKSSDGSILEKELEPADAVMTAQAAAQISLDDANVAALSDAGVSAADVTYTKNRLDYDDGIFVYEIEFYTANQSYDYEIDATTGAIRKKSTESFQSPAGTNAGVQNSGSYIDADAAKSIALSHAGLSSSDVTFSKTKLEMDDGYTCYEVEFYHGRTEYDYKIDAVSGNILEFDSEID